MGTENRALSLSLMRKLEQVPAYLMLPEKTLFQEVNMGLAEPASRGEMQAAMKWAQDKGWVDYVQDDFVGRRWRLTGEGRVRLAEVSG